MNVRDIGQNTVNSALIDAQTSADSNSIEVDLAIERSHMERINELREQIKAGTYRPSSDEIAKAMFRHSTSDK
ncbi:MAG: flagellar biosynthesis anti-sigma factor FlgM [Fimbriimonadaceae bacterium]